MQFLKKLFGGSSSDTGTKNGDRPAAADRGRPVRDQLIKDHQFFDERVAQAQLAVDRIPELKSEMMARPEPPTDLSDFYDGVCSWHHDLIAAKYSRGDAVQELIPLCHVTAATASGVLAAGERADGGRFSWKTLSRAIAFAVYSDAPAKDFAAISAMLRDGQFSGLIVDYLVASRVPDHPVGDGPFLAGYPSVKTLAEIIRTSDPAACLELSKTYLESQFYTAKNMEGEYERHKKFGGASYYGYWAWQLGAILRVKSVDVSSLEDTPYFPYDFVTYGS